MFCSNCGKENLEASKFCHSCGKPMGALKLEVVESVSGSKSKWKYNFWKDPNIAKIDKVLGVLYVIITIFFPISALIWLFVIWIVRGRKLPLLYKQCMSIGLVLGAIGGYMGWHDAYKAPSTAMQQGWFQQQ